MLLKSLILSLFLFSVNAAEITIECGDTNKAYVEMDLSEEFTADHSEIINGREYRNVFAGRNCGLNRWDNNHHMYEVLFAFKRKSRTDLFGLDTPFHIRRATFTFSSDERLLEELVKNEELELVLTGKKGDLKVDGFPGVNASVKTKRGASQGLIIIRRTKQI